MFSGEEVSGSASPAHAGDGVVRGQVSGRDVEDCGNVVVHVVAGAGRGNPFGSVVVDVVVVGSLPAGDRIGLKAPAHGVVVNRIVGAAREGIEWDLKRFPLRWAGRSGRSSRVEENEVQSQEDFDFPFKFTDFLVAFTEWMT